MLAQLGVPESMAERGLNHKLRGVKGIYNKHDYFEERKEAIDKLSYFVCPIVK